MQETSPPKLLATFSGSGILTRERLVQALEALEKRKLEYHRAVPTRVDSLVEDEVQLVVDDLEEEALEESYFVTRSLRQRWEVAHLERPLFDEGLAGFRAKFPELPPGFLGFRIRLGYRFPGLDPEPLWASFESLAGGRFRVGLEASGERAQDPRGKAHSKAATLLFADLAEALYDQFEPVHGEIFRGGPVPSDRVPCRGWGFYGPELVAAAGPTQVEAFAKSCFKSWELADGGWFLAPRPLVETEVAGNPELRQLFARARHWPLEGLRPAPERKP